MKKILPITLTETAVKKIFEIRGQKQIGEESYLRLGVKSAGCGIASYIIGFDYKNDKDDLFEIGNVKVIIEKIQVMHLAGKHVDYGESEGETGFIFRDKD